MNRLGPIGQGLVSLAAAFLFASISIGAAIGPAAFEGPAMIYAAADADVARG